MTKSSTVKRLRAPGQLMLLTTILLISSCDCVQNVSGIVVDKDTKRAIEGAYVQNANKNYNHLFTNNKGEFTLNSISGGLRKCPSMQVAITKSNYEIKNVEIENGSNDTIYLEKIR